MKIKLLTAAAILAVVPGVALASPFDDSFFGEDSSDSDFFEGDFSFETSFDDDFFSDSDWEDSFSESPDQEMIGFCDEVEIGSSDTEINIEEDYMMMEGVYCANTAGYEVTDTGIQSDSDEILVSVNIESPGEDQYVNQVITSVDYSAETEIDEHERIEYEIKLDGDVIESGERYVESETSDDMFGDDWFTDDFFSDTPQDDSGDSTEPGNGDTDVTEDAYIEPAPEPGDFYYEAGTDRWVSYVNPRDEYHPERESREEYPGSGKVCMTLLNEDGEHISGETVPNTQAVMETEGLEWHSLANPFTVEFPVTENYERPLDADQFGTSEDVPQGDGYMDSHCLEMHLVDEDFTFEYGEVEITGEHADDVEVVGYVQQVGQSWDSDVDPIEDAESYEETGGGWTLPDHTHAQVVAVLQLDR